MKNANVIRAFNRRKGKILVQYPGSPGLRRCANRNAAGEELHFRRQYYYWDRAIAAETRSARIDRILTRRAQRVNLNSLWTSQYFPLLTSGSCPCCGASRGGKYYLTEKGRERLAELRRQRGVR